MIKLKKIVAVALSAAMCLGMSMTAFAAQVYDTDQAGFWSPNYVKNLVWGDGVDVDGDGVADYANATFDTVTDQYGHRIDYNVKRITNKNTLESINSEGKIREILEKAGYDVPKDVDIVPVLANTIDLDKGLSADGAYAWIDFEELGIDEAGYAAGQKIQVLRETYAGSGEWEVVEAELVESQANEGLGTRLQARIQLTNRSQSLVVLRVMSDGTTVRVLDKKNGTTTVVPNGAANGTISTSTSSAANASPQASPKTGEF